MGISNPVHIAFLALVALLVLGPKRLPDVAKTLGSGLREFRNAMNLASMGDDTSHHSVGPHNHPTVAQDPVVPAVPDPPVGVVEGNGSSDVAEMELRLDVPPAVFSESPAVDSSAAEPAHHEHHAFAAWADMGSSAEPAVPASHGD